jgi:hypothetical protein
MLGYTLSGLNFQPTAGYVKSGLYSHEVRSNREEFDIYTEMDRFYNLILRMHEGRNVAGELEEMFNKVSGELQEDVQNLLLTNLKRFFDDSKKDWSLDNRDFYGLFPSKYKWAYGSFLALISYTLEKMPSSKKAITKLESSLRTMDKLKDFGDLSLPLVMLSNLWVFYRDDAVSAFNRIPKSFEQLPGKLKYHMVALRLLHSGFHTKSEITDNDVPDFATTESNLDFTIKTLKNGIQDRDISANEKQELELKLSQGLVQLLFGMGGALTCKPDDKGNLVSQDFFQRLEIKSHEGKEKIKKFKQTISENKHTVLKAINLIRKNDETHKISVALQGWAWPYRFITKLPSRVDENGNKVCLDELLLNPYKHKDFLISCKEKNIFSGPNSDLRTPKIAARVTELYNSLESAVQAA